MASPSKFSTIGALFGGLLACTGAAADETALTLSAEVRLRYDSHEQGQLIRGNSYGQGLLRGVLGADLRIHPQLRAYGEIATGQVVGRRDSAAANFQNRLSLQQLFVEARGQLGPARLSAVLGRQEFADGPRQLVSVSDGPNLHRSWNGLRADVQGQGLRVTAFDLRATRPGRGGFDETVNPAERLQGLKASWVVSAQDGAQTNLDPFWMHSENPNFRVAGRLGRDRRDTWGLRLWGRQGRLSLDWTLALQTGGHLGRDIDAWGLFTVHSLALSAEGWKPRLTAHIDIASGGGADSGGRLKGFNPLYASSAYLGEGQFLGLSNLLLIAPGLALSPTPATTLSVEYGWARRLKPGDAAYAGGLRAYAGTQQLPQQEIGGLLRIVGTWSLGPRLSLFVNHERFDAGELLQRAGLPSGRYSYVGASWRY